MSIYTTIPLILALLLSAGAFLFYSKLMKKPFPNDDSVIPVSDSSGFKDGSSIKINAPLILALNQDDKVEFQGYAADQGVMVFDFNRKSPSEINASYRFIQGEEVFSGKFLREDILDFLREWKPTLIDAPNGNKNGAGETHIDIKFDVEDIRAKISEYLQAKVTNKTTVVLKPVKELSILDGANALFISSNSGHIVSVVIPYKTLQAMVSEWYTQVSIDEERNIFDNELMALLEQETK